MNPAESGNPQTLRFGSAWSSQCVVGCSSAGAVQALCVDLRRARLGACHCEKRAGCDVVGLMDDVSAVLGLPDSAGFIPGFMPDSFFGVAGFTSRIHGSRIYGSRSTLLPCLHAAIFACPQLVLRKRCAALELHDGKHTSGSCNCATV